MAHVELLPVYHNSHLNLPGNLSLACNSESNFQELKRMLSYEKESWNLYGDSSRTSQESFDSGYQSSSPELSPKREKDKTDVLTSDTHDFSFNTSEENSLAWNFQGQEDQGTDGKKNRFISEMNDALLPELLLLKLELDREESLSPVEELFHHVSPLQMPTKEMAGCEKGMLEVEELSPPNKFIFPPILEETVPHNNQEVEPQGEAIIPQYIVEKRAVRHLQETVHQHHSYKAYQCEQVLVGQSKAEVVPQSMAEVVSHCNNDIDPHCKAEVPHTKEVLVIKVKPQSKDFLELHHKEVQGVVEPQSKGEEGPPCKCDLASRLCEHMKDSVLKLRKRNDPLFSKKRLRRLFRVYVPEDLEEPPFQYVPEVLPTSASIKGVVPPLQESLMLLGEGLEAGSLVAQFEQLYRRKPGLTVTEARRQENEKKNRYRDISPYDSTRVILTTAPSGDYINASYVNMEVQASGIVNRYIASQGPLAGTCNDFWHMVWEQQSTLIVMLTTVVEQGRVKCHRYWPRLYETVDFGILQVTCNKEEETPGFAFREFTLINTETQEERHITHMQYLAWPDHGVPDDSTEFLNFVTQVRKARAGMVEPTIVHCSAGIGRTGVLILMETAQCLIEANEPIYPLDIVKAMRDQRAMMIQTASQFRFVCEAIHRVYTEELIKPLAEYEQR